MKAAKRKPENFQVWEFTAEGKALAAVIVLVSAHENEAWEMARKQCVEYHLDPDTLILAHSEPFSSPMVVYGWDGDY